VARIHYLPTARHPWKPEGLHDFNPLPVDLDGNRVLIFGRHAGTMVSESNAARSAAAIQLLHDLGWDVRRITR
jgi:hypothetical protein